MGLGVLLMLLCAPCFATTQVLSNGAPEKGAVSLTLSGALLQANSTHKPTDKALSTCSLSSSFPLTNPSPSQTLKKKHLPCQMSQLRIAITSATQTAETAMHFYFISDGSRRLINAARNVLCGEIFLPQSRPSLITT